MLMDEQPLSTQAEGSSDRSLYPKRALKADWAVLPLYFASTHILNSACLLPAEKNCCFQCDGPRLKCLYHC